MFFDFINDKEQKAKRLAMANSDQQSLYIKAYSELIIYLKLLFTHYNALITDNQLHDFIHNNYNWGWLSFFKTLNLCKFENITFVTYNYDIWLERILKDLNIQYNVLGFTNNKQANVILIKPHGSINFVNKSDYAETLTTINYKLDFDMIEIDKLILCDNEIDKYYKSAIIPPAGDSTRMLSATWASYLRKGAIEAAKKIDKSDEVVVCGMSYWHVDRKELDELLINLDPYTNLTLINPNPPRDLNAVLSSIFKNYVLQTSSDMIGGILNGKTL